MVSQLGMISGKKIQDGKNQYLALIFSLKLKHTV